jgi:SAM-dependent methyltransferase
MSPDMRNHEHLSLRFGETEVVRSPLTLGAAEENHVFSTMTQRLLAESKPGDRVLEIGSRARSGNTNRHLVHPDVEYVGVDITDGPNVDVVGDAHHLSRHVTGQFDAIFSVSVFEHLLMPWMVALEMNKVLKVGGMAYIQSHACFPLHDQPWDFWRFTKEAWAGLFNAHTGFEIIEKGGTMRCKIAHEWSAISHLEPSFDDGGSHVLSACLVRKVGPAKVQWDAEAPEVYDLSYSHA